MSGKGISTKAEMQRRVTEVYKMVVAGLPRRDIFRLCREKHGWDMCDRQLDTYCQRAERLLEEESKPVRGVELGKALARYTTQYAKADARKDHRGAAMIEDKIVNLLGLAAPQKAEITLANIPLSELEAELARLEAKIAAADGDAANDG